VEAWIARLLNWLEAAPSTLVYLVLGGFAFAENLVPPVPADVVILFGGLLAGRGALSLPLVFVTIWVLNVAGAMTVYGLGARYGLRIFQAPVGRWILRPGQMVRIGEFQRRHGFWVLFASRFLPMFRAVVPAFAGISGIGFLRALVPIALASGVWYGFIVSLGAFAGARWEAIHRQMAAAGPWLQGLAVLLLALAVVWWVRTRKAEP
jgi:membrane protein DedA with SNARE-associated domain